MRNANNENTSKGNFKRYGTVCAGFCAGFFQKKSTKNRGCETHPRIYSLNNKTNIIY